MDESLLLDIDCFVLHHFEQCAYHTTGEEANRQVIVSFTRIGREIDATMRKGYLSRR